MEIELISADPSSMTVAARPETPAQLAVYPLFGGALMELGDPPERCRWVFVVQK